MPPVSETMATVTHEAQHLLYRSETSPCVLGHERCFKFKLFDWDFKPSCLLNDEAVL